MNRIVVEPSIRASLDNLSSRLELCDESGEILGYFVPASERDPLLYAWARTEFTDEEIDLALQEPGGLTIEEVLADLGD